MKKSRKRYQQKYQVERFKQYIKEIAHIMI